MDPPHTEAIPRVLEARPDMVILDPRAPFTAGLDVVRALKQVHGRVRIVVLSNSAGPRYRDRALAAGAEAHFDKSAELERLLELLPPSDQRPVSPPVA
jgi:DNA-binding NarL/FixJ family response regulator